MTARIDLSGRVFGRLTVKEFAGSPKALALWLCRCECGAATVARGDKLRRGITRSCGCLSSEMTSSRSRTHGMAANRSRPPEYSVWAQMIQRCSNPNNTRWRDYGGRGIRVHPDWLAFATWFAAMGPRPSPRHSIDRIDNDGNYEPGNCRWATRAQQDANRRCSVTPEGEVK